MSVAMTCSGWQSFAVAVTLVKVFATNEVTQLELQ